MASLPPTTMPSPGRMMSPSASPKKADTMVKPMIHLKVCRPILPTSLPPTLPMAAEMAVITSSTTDIWIKRIKMSPMNLRLAAQGPTSDPKTIPAIVASRIMVVRDGNLTFRFVSDMMSLLLSPVSMLYLISSASRLANRFYPVSRYPGPCRGLKSCSLCRCLFVFKCPRPGCSPWSRCRRNPPRPRRRRPAGSRRP